MCDNKEFYYTFIDKESNIDMIKIQKMAFIYNALDNGWSIKKRGDYYVFKKQHDGKEEVFLDSYLTNFINDNINILNNMS